MAEPISVTWASLSQVLRGAIASSTDPSAISTGFFETFLKLTCPPGCSHGVARQRGCWQGLPGRPLCRALLCLRVTRTLWTGSGLSALAGGRGCANTPVPSAHCSGDYSSTQPRSAAALPIRASPESRRFRQALRWCKAVSLVTGVQLLWPSRVCPNQPQAPAMEGEERVPAASESAQRSRSVFARLGWGSSEMPVHFQRNINHYVYTSFSSADPCLTARMGFTVN